MSAKTKIVVLHMKELIYTAIFAALGILFVILLVIMFLPDKKDSASKDPAIPQTQETQSTQTASSVATYIPGIYTTQLVLGNQSVDVEVIVGQENISSVRLANLSEDITTLYPLLQPALDSICEQLYETQSLNEVTYSPDSKYTSLVLLEAIRNSLEKAMPKQYHPVD